jgi:hypothetical protein
MCNIISHCHTTKCFSLLGFLTKAISILSATTLLPLVAWFSSVVVKRREIALVRTSNWMPGLCRVFEFFVYGVGASVAIRIKVLQPILDRCSSLIKGALTNWSLESIVRH